MSSSVAATGSHVTEAAAPPIQSGARCDATVERRWGRWGLLGLVVAACQTLAGSELDRVRCAAEGEIGPPTCPEGESCQHGVCSACLEHEVCANRIDDDCNGAVDDGCAIDATAGAGGGIPPEAGAAGGGGQRSAGAAGSSP